MRKHRKIITIAVCSLLLLTGCGNSMFNKAVEQGKLAMAGMEYEKARASFQLALEEKEDDEVKAMLEEVSNMVAGLNAKKNDNIEEALEYFSKVSKEDSIFPSMSEEADKLGQELQKVQEEINYYEQQFLEAETYIKEKQYAEGKELLNQIIEETKDHKVLIVVNGKAQGALEQIHIEVAQIEEQRKEQAEIKRQEEARQAELEKKKREISNAGLLDILVQGSERAQESIISSRILEGQFTASIEENTKDGIVYYTPYRSEFNSRTKIEDYLRPYFSKTAIKSMLQENTREMNGKLYYCWPEMKNFAVYKDPDFYYNPAEIIERIDNGNTINVKVRVYLWDSSYPTDVTYIYENGKWVINSELEDWGTG